MLVTYNPEDGDEQAWEFDPNRVRQSEGEMIEKRFGGSFLEFTQGVLTSNSKALRVLLWFLMRKQHHTLRYEDVPDFYLGELIVSQTAADIQRLRDNVMRSPASKAEKEAALVELDAMLAELSDESRVIEGKAV